MISVGSAPHWSFCECGMRIACWICGQSWMDAASLDRDAVSRNCCFPVRSVRLGCARSCVDASPYQSVLKGAILLRRGNWDSRSTGVLAQRKRKLSAKGSPAVRQAVGMKTSDNSRMADGSDACVAYQIGQTRLWCLRRSLTSTSHHPPWTNGAEQIHLAGRVCMWCRGVGGRWWDAFLSVSLPKL